MDLPESATQSFIVKVWLEESTGHGRRAIWHGRVTHVASGESRPMRRLGDVPAIIAPHLIEIGADVGLYWRLRCWLARQRHKSAR